MAICQIKNIPALFDFGFFACQKEHSINKLAQAFNISDPFCKIGILCAKMPVPTFWRYLGP